MCVCVYLHIYIYTQHIYIYIYMLTPQLARTSSEDVSSLLQSVAGKLLFVRHQLSIFVDAGIKVLMFLQKLFTIVRDLVDDATITLHSITLDVNTVPMRKDNVFLNAVE